MKKSAAVPLVVVEPAAFWTAVAKRSDDTAFAPLARDYSTPRDTGNQSGVALRFPPQSKTVRKSSLLALLVVAFIQLGGNAAESPAVTSRPTLFLIGDSTVKNGTRGLMGWGEVIAAHFDTNRIAVVNRAIGGRSSRTFFTEGRWDQVLAEMKPGDFVLMQFGHNDGGSLTQNRGRGSLKGTDDRTEEITLTNGTKEVVHTFGWYLRKYVTDTKAKGATPIVCSLVPRNDWKNGRVLRGTNSYEQFAAEVARQEQVGFINLHESIATKYEAAGQEKVTADYFLNEHTHTTPVGAALNAASVVAGLRALTNCALAAFLRPDAGTNKTAADAPIPPLAYLFAYFINNGEDGLHLASSRDGYHWEALNGGKSFLQPEVGESKLLRDPCVLRGPDGTFHMVWTTSWQGKTIGYASSKDLIHWSPQQAIPVMAHESAALNCWAPEIVWDAKRSEFIIFWATTITNKFRETAGTGDDKYNHRIYSVTTKDFKSYTPAKLFYDPGFNVIDATILSANGRFYLIVKDETRNPAKKHLRIASSDDIAGPYTDLSAPLTRDWVEGPSALKVDDGYLVYFDAYRDRHYEAMHSTDLKNWQDVTSKTSFPKGMKHGTAIAVDGEWVKALRNTMNAASAKSL